MSAFATYNKNRADRSKLLHKALDETMSGKTYKDEEGFWRPTLDKAGTGWAVIRFLPAGKNEELPYVEMFSYAFKAQGGWYIEKSRQTLGAEEPDPAKEYISTLWNAGKEDEARKYSRRRYFVSNVLVINDPGNPENNGKVFLYKYP